MSSTAFKNSKRAIFLLIILISSLASVVIGLQYSVLIRSTGSIDYDPTGIVFEDGFESGDFSKWDGTATSLGETGTIVDTLSYHGKYSAMFTSGGDSSSETAYCYKSVKPYVELYARGYFYVSQSGIANDNNRFYFIRFDYLAYAGWRQVNGVVRWNLIVRNETGWAVAYSDWSPSVNQWYCVELHWGNDGIDGCGELYVNGELVCSIYGLNTAAVGNVGEARFGLAELYQCENTIIYSDCCVISKTYIGQLAPGFGTWGIVGPKDEIIQMNNIFWLFGNQSIPYVHLYHYEVTSYESIKDYAGLVTWTSPNRVYNSTAVKLFAKTRPVISHVFDFCSILYPSLANGIQSVSTRTVTYAIDWGNFRKGDRPEMHNGQEQLTTVMSSYLSGFLNVTTIARFDTNLIALFHMKGDNDNAGFYVMDLYATLFHSYEAGNWHIFPAVAKAAEVKAGRYSRWIQYYVSLDWIYSWMTNFANSNKDIVTMKSIGTSVEGRPINALFIGNGTRNFIADACIHGGEKAGPPAIIRFAELILEWYRATQEWRQKLNQYKIILIPVLNPDGYVASHRENANGLDLNRQFPPRATTTEPEAWALRWLMGNYTPIHYATLHTGDPLWVYYTGSSIYNTYGYWAAKEGDLIFQDLKHWGTVFLSYATMWAGKYDRIISMGTSSSLSAPYAFYAHQATALLVEHFADSPRYTLHSTDYYITAMLGLLLHHDRTASFMIHSNTFIWQSTYTSATGLSINVDAAYIAANRNSETKIFDFDNSGKPSRVSIDGFEKVEGNGWSWDSSSSIITVTDANDSIHISWSG